VPYTRPWLRFGASGWWQPPQEATDGYGFDAVRPASTVSPGAAVTSASLAAVEPSTSAAVRRQNECPGDEEVSAKKAKREADTK